MEFNELQTAEEYIKLMKPLVAPGRLAMQIVGQPTRSHEKQIFAQAVEMAKKHKLHRNMRHAQCGIKLSFDETNQRKTEFDRTILHINISSMTPNDYMRRIIIIVSMACILFILLTKTMR